MCSCHYQSHPFLGLFVPPFCHHPAQQCPLPTSRSPSCHHLILLPVPLGAHLPVAASAGTGSGANGLTHALVLVLPTLELAQMWFTAYLWHAERPAPAQVQVRIGLPNINETLGETDPKLEYSWIEKRSNFLTVCWRTFHLQGPTIFPSPHNGDNFLNRHKRV